MRILVSFEVLFEYRSDGLLAFSHTLMATEIATAHGISQVHN